MRLQTTNTLPLSLFKLVVFMRRATVTLVAGSLCSVVSAQQSPTTFETHTSIKNDTSPPLKSIAVGLAPLERREIDPPRLNPNRTGAMAAMFALSVTDTSIQSKTGPVVPIKVLASSDGLGNGFKSTQGNPMTVSSVPPDTNGAVGDTQYIQIVNTFFAIFNKADLIKAGTTPPGEFVKPVFGWAPVNSVWQGFGAKCEENNDGDPIVQYDKIAKRWIITQFRVHGGGFSQCVAVSTTSDATGSYHRYEFDEPSFNDYPKAGVWPDAYYITYNMFGNPQGARVCAYERNKMLTGVPAREIAVQLSPNFFSLLPSDFDGVPDNDHLPPVGSPCYFLSLGIKPNSLDVWKFHVDFNTPNSSTFGGPNATPDKTIDVAPFSDAPSLNAVPQLGTSQKLDGLGDRLMYRLAYRRFSDHESLVVTHSVSGNSLVAPRWYEIRDPNGAPAIFQQGTFSPDSTSRWMGSIAMDRLGNIALGYSASSSSKHPSIQIAAQKAGGAKGILGTETTVIDSKSSQEGASRWGDYSSMSADPTDDSTFWYTTEYLAGAQNGDFNWSTRIVAFMIESNSPNNKNVANLEPNGAAETSGIQGTVVLRPTESVEKIGKRNSAPLANTVISIRSARGDELMQAKADEKGAFHVALPPGTYQVVPLQPNPSSRYPKASPQTVEVELGKSKKITVEYDSGMR